MPRPALALILAALVACGARTPLGASGSNANGAGALRPIAPLSTSVVTTQRPTFHWTGAVAVQIDVCIDRACSKLETSFEGDGSSATIGTTLSPGVHYWRLHPIVDGAPASATTAVWEFRVPHRSSPRDTSWGEFPDFDGDGFADLIVRPGITETLTIFPGSPSGVQQDRQLQIKPFPSHLIGGIAAVGDVDGDGFGDFAVARELPDGLAIYRGGPTGLDPEQPSYEIEPPSDAKGLVFGAITSAGDLNADGYADVVVDDGPDASLSSRFLIYFGGPSGLSRSPSIVLSAPAFVLSSDEPQPIWASVTEAGDFDGDGFSDLVEVVPHAETGTPGVYLYRGSATGPSDATRVFLASLPVDPECLVPPLSPTPGDLNGDGFADVVVGLVDCVHSKLQGRYMVIYGGPSPQTTVVTLPPGFNGGFAAHIAWDVDGDGYDDLATGASQGSVSSGGLLYWGSPSGVSDAARTTFDTSSSSPDDPNGFAVTASDLDGDGLEDVTLASFQGTRVSTFSGGPSSLEMKTTVTPPNPSEFYEPILR